MWVVPMEVRCAVKAARASAVRWGDDGWGFGVDEAGGGLDEGGFKDGVLMVDGAFSDGVQVLA